MSKYLCNLYLQEQDAKYFDWASVFGPDNAFINTFKDLAKELNVVLPLSFFERYNNAFYNSIAVSRLNWYEYLRYI